MNNRDIVSQSTKDFEGILLEIMRNVEKQDKTIDDIENLIKSAISTTIKIFLSFISLIVSNTSKESTSICKKCNNKMKVVSKNADISIMTMFGKLLFKRDYVYCRFCKNGYGLGDKIVGIGKTHRLTNGMIDLITYIGQLVPFGEGRKVIEKFYGFMGVDVSESVIQSVSEKIGKKVYDNNLSDSEYLYDNHHKLDDLTSTSSKSDLYIMLDGSHVNTRIEDEEGSSWKEMKLGEVFSSKDIIKRKNKDSIITKKEYCTHLGSVSTFKKILFKCAYDNNYLGHENIVIVADGAPWIWNLADEFFPESVKILDFYHLSENINSYSKVLFTKNDIERKKWVKEILELIQNDNVNLAIKLINENAIEKDLLPAGVVNLPEYIKNNRERINYYKYKENGYYIGSGAIESGNKTVIQQRMKQSGMRWSTEGAQYIAALRAKYKSDKWCDIQKVI